MSADPERPVKPVPASPARRTFLKQAGLTTAGLATWGGLAAFLEACATNQQGSPQGSAGSSAGRKGGTVVEGINSDPDSLNPMLAVNNVGTITNRLLFEGMLGLAADGSLQPALADLPTVSSDSKTYTFKLKSDIKWSDGSPITADDVVFTFKTLIAPEYKEFNSFQRSLAEQYIATVDSPDAGTIVVTTKTVYAPALYQFGFLTPILPSKVLGSMAPAELNTTSWNNAPDPVSGVFKLRKWTRGSLIEYERNPNYFLGPSNLDGYSIKILQDAVALATAARTGDVDIAGQIEYSQIASLNSASNLKVLGIQSDEAPTLGFQLRPDQPASQFFSDKAVRQALAYAVDKENLLKAAAFGSGVINNSCEPPQSWAFDPNVSPVYNYDLDKAGSMLDAAGWAKGSDGTRQKNGVPFKFTILTDNQHGDHVTIAQAVQNSWKQLGLQVDVKLVQFSDLIQNVIFKRTFDVFIIGQQMNNNGPDPDEFNSWYSSSIGNISGFTGADQAIDQGLSTLDQDQRKAAYKDLQAVLAEEVPAIPLWFLKYAWAVNNRVGNFNVGPYQMLGGRTWMKDVYVTG
jgi:peptide/nickel transport system substrate-binding protein